MIKARPKSIYYFNAVLLIAIMIVLYIIHVIYVDAKRQAISQFKQHQEVLVRQASISLQNYIQDRIRALEVLADFPASKKLDIPIFLTEYERTFKMVGGFESIQFIDSLGKIEHGYPVENIFSTHILEDTLHFGTISNFFYAVQNSHSSIITPIIYGNDENTIIYLMCPVYDKNRFKGIILGKLRIKPLILKSIEPIFVDYNGSCWIIQKSGELVYHPFHKEFLPTSVRNPQSSCIECHSDFKHELQIITDKTGSLTNAGIEHNYITSFTTLSITNINWKIVVSMPTETIQSVINHSSKNLILLGIIMVVLSIFISIINAYNLLRRVKVETRAFYLEKEIGIQNEKIQLETQYQSLVENLQDGIFITNNNKITFANQSFCSILGVQRKNIIGNNMSIEDFISPSDVERLKTYIQSVLEGGKSSDFVEINGINKNKGTINLIVIINQFVINKQKIIQGIIRDVTEFKRLAKEKSQNEHLAKLGEMSARLAHEIKNPLASIQTGIQVLKQRIKGFTTEQEYCDRIIHEIKRTDSIIRSLLIYARQQDLKKEYISLSIPLHEVLTVMEHALKQKQIKVNIEEYDGLPYPYIDASLWKQIFWNLLDNAIQACSANDEITIRMTANSSVAGDQNIIITITDTGKGIQKGNEKRIFDPFFSTKTQGTGLGLAITKRLIEMHHGKISAEVIPKGGSRFVISLPIYEQKEN
jgi:PAS domain S-box-containing protein